ncbi:hypothetical protein LOC68_19700 [Blastopirellula sp. JC732]|uniref:Uncharacterized protein n=1 Tax=Blastopirellula sediminis TaxID=2894196 RepID=A0A9X1SGX9_9BACT|nr:hypothetical protein [Blastopirellula sediminis]MCC9606076.1 hypothetical protein [Blastopirellula sediminis]MCC9630625.1 hypothetical protein [Blastopirellula sediminis]
MSAERRTSIRFPVMPENVNGRLVLGKEEFRVRLLDESMAGFAIELEVAKTRLQTVNPEHEEEFFLFGEIAQLILNSSAFEVQVTSVGFKNPPPDRKLHPTKALLRVGVRIIREISAVEFHRAAWRRAAAIIFVAASITFGVSLGMFKDQLLTAGGSEDGSLSGLLASMSQEWNQYASGVSAPRHDGLNVLASQGQQLHLFAQKLRTDPMPRRVQRITAMGSPEVWQSMNLSEQQQTDIHKILLEANAHFERIWTVYREFKSELENRIAAYLDEVEIRILSQLTSAQAQSWAQIGL